MLIPRGWGAQVYIITGANTGVGKDLAHILYSKNAKVYVGSRSKEKGTKAIEELRARSPQSKGELVLLQLDLADLTTIKAPVEEFLSRETRLDVLFNNAGVMAPPQGSKSAQGYELHLGTNNVGPHLLTRLLTPMLVATAKAEAEAGRRAAVRVVWVSSLATECFSPTGGVEMEHLNYHGDATWMYKYGVSKAGNYLQATEFARRHRGDGVVSVAVNPGNLDSELYRTQPSLLGRFMKTFVLWPSVYGAYTELFGGLSPEVTFEKTGAWSESS